jgi:UDP-glucose/GDP-mannose dehydrogenase family, NAD binding domain
MTVIGCGHLGAAHAAAMAEIGHEVMGIDVDERKIAALSRGHAWFKEPGLDGMLSRHLAGGGRRALLAGRPARLTAEPGGHRRRGEIADRRHQARGQRDCRRLPDAEHW